MPTRKLIFVPTYNERENVEAMVRELVALNLDADLLFLDDGSPDGTGGILDRLAAKTPRLSVVHRPGKAGIGTAHQHGIRHAYAQGYDVLITLDCDFTHKPGDIRTLLDALRGHDLSTGSRYMEAGSLPDWNLLRRSLTAVGHLLTRRLLSIKYDATGALRAYDLRRIDRRIFDEVEAGGYGFFFESMFRLTRAGYTVGEFPIVLPARTYGTSKMSLRETLKSGMRLIALWAGTIGTRRPLRTKVENRVDALE